MLQFQSTAGLGRRHSRENGNPGIRRPLGSRFHGNDGDILQLLRIKTEGPNA